MYEQREKSEVNKKQLNSSRVNRPKNTAKLDDDAVDRRYNPMLQRQHRGLVNNLVSTHLQLRPRVVQKTKKADDTADLDGTTSETKKATSELTTNVSVQILKSRQRQLAMLDDNVGFNISPIAWDSYPTIGRSGTFISDKKGITDIIGEFSGLSQLTLNKSQVLQLEEAFGLEPGTLQEGFKIRKIDNILEQMTRSPMEGNQFFKGGGNHLPGGAPEMVIDSVSTLDTDNVKTLVEVLVE